MRILLMPHSFLPDGKAGVEVYTQNLAWALKDLGHDVGVAVPRREPSAESSTAHLVYVDRNGELAAGGEGSLQVYRLPAAMGQMPNLLVCNPPLYRRFSTLLDGIKPDIVHFQHMIHMDPRLPQLCHARGIPTLLHLHDYFYECVAFQKLNARFEYCGGVEPQRCIECLSGFGVQNPLLALSEYVKNRSLFLSDIDKVLGVSEFVSKGFLQQWRILLDGLAAAWLNNWVETVPNPVPWLERLQPLFSGYVERFKARRRLGEPLQFIQLGTISESKGALVVAQAFEDIDPSLARLTLAGHFGCSGSYREKLEAIAAKTPAVRLLGGYSPADLGQLLAASDALVFGSIWQETFGLVIAEARAAGLPVLVSDFGVACKFVRDGIDGAWFKVRDSLSLRKKVEEYLSAPGAFLYQHENIQTNFVSPAQNAKQVENIYKSLLAKHRRTEQ